MKPLEPFIPTILKLCRLHRVRRLAAFGSVLTDNFTEQSDVDLLVTFDENLTPHTYTENFFALYHALKSLLGREVDLVDDDAVKNPYFRQELNETQRLIYG